MSNYIQKNYVEGKVVLITGGSNGFGKILAQKVAEMGGIPVIGARNEAALQSVAAGIEAAGGKCYWRKTDVSKVEDVNALAQLAIEKCGRIDVLVNNAGTMPLAYYADHVKTLDKWVECIDTNLKGTLYGICAVYDQMIQQGEGQVINISSIYANYPVAGSAVYQATKIGVEYLAESLRQETQGKIKVSCVKPTGVPATGLFSCIVNMNAAAEMLGMKALDYMTMSSELPGRPDLQDRESISYLNCDPEALVDNIIYLINQPMGINISDITVRSSNERYML
jgi:NADP-dependent 3-hydroxy acid dehydrogenase YdfG